MKGRQPKTESELKKRGTFEKSKHAERAEITPLIGMPPAPADFDEKRAYWWSHFCADIQKASVLAEQHLNAVRLMADLMACRIELSEQLKTEGYTFKTEGGMIKQHPAFSLRKQVDDQLIRLYEQFGFTLRSGMTIKAPEKPKTSIIIEMMKGRQDKKAV